MTDLPVAMQLFSRTTSGNEIIKRQGWCPECGQRSTTFMGVQPDMFSKDAYWVFKCKSKAEHSSADRRIFRNVPDPTAPQDEKGVEIWKASQRLAWALEKAQ